MHKFPVACNKVFKSLMGVPRDFSASALFVNLNHTINQAAFVCLSVCSPTHPRSFDGSSPNLVGVCRWTSELPLRCSFWKRSTGRRVNRSMGQMSLSRSRRHQAEATPLQNTRGVLQQKVHGV